MVSKSVANNVQYVAGKLPSVETVKATAGEIIDYPAKQIANKYNLNEDNTKTVGREIMKIGAGVAVMSYGVPWLVGKLGFTTSGMIGGSVGSRYQSWMCKGLTSGLTSTLQRAGAKGLPTYFTTILPITLPVTALGMRSIWQQQKSKLLGANPQKKTTHEKEE